MNSALRSSVQLKCLRRALALLALTSLLLMQRNTLLAQDGGSAADHELLRKLAERVNQLETELKELRSRPAANTAIPPTASAAPSAAMLAELSQTTKETYPKLDFHGFGDVSYTAGNTPGVNNHFHLGQFDMFLTSRLSPKVSVLSEVVIEADNNNNFGIEMERLLLQMKLNDWFNVDIGRYHSAVGYYNTAYHHGTWFQTAVGRPGFLDFEDGGGLIPAHNVGISINGAIPSGSAGLHYIAEIGNGRPYQASGTGKAPVLNVSDDNNYKSVNVALTAKPDALPGLQLGAGFYHDTITPTGLPRMDEILLHSHAVYKAYDWEFLNEGYLMRHAVDGGPTHWTPAFFSQVGKRFGDFTPYVRYQYVNAPLADAALALIGAAGLTYGPSVGLRYDFTTYAAFKAQFDHLKSEAAGRTLNQVTLQAAFTF